MDYTFDFRVIAENWGLLLAGLWATFVVSFVALGIGVVIGTAVGILRLSRNRVLRSLSWAYIEVLRNTPGLVQIIWVYYCLPILVGVDFGAIASCAIALSLQSGAYIGEIVRGGIAGVDKGQSEAARTVGLSAMQTMFRVVLPQAFRRMIAPLVNQVVTLIKYSSLVSVVGVADLTYQAQLLSTTTFRPLEIFSFLALEYLVICACFSYLAGVVERKLEVAG